MIAAGLIACAMYAGACLEDYLFCRVFARGAEGQLGRNVDISSLSLGVSFVRG